MTLQPVRKPNGRLALFVSALMLALAPAAFDQIAVLRAQRGLSPRISPPNIGGKILERIQRLSKELGTTIAIENNVGVIRVP